MICEMNRDPGTGVVDHTVELERKNAGSIGRRPTGTVSKFLLTQDCLPKIKGQVSGKGVSSFCQEIDNFPLPAWGKMRQFIR